MNDNFTLPPSPNLNEIQHTSITSDNGVFPPAGNPRRDRAVVPTIVDTPETEAITPTDPSSEDENTEENEITEVSKQYKLTPKFNAWVQYFTDPKEKDTYGNKTQSAIKAYNLDPVAQYSVAGHMGWENYKKLKNVASLFAENKGYTFDKMMDAAWLKFLQSQSSEWFVILADMFGYRDLKPAVVVDNRTQNNTLIQVAEGEQKSFNDQFRDFVKSS